MGLHGKTGGSMDLALWVLPGAVTSQVGGQQRDKQSSNLPKDGRRQQFCRARCVNCERRGIHQRAGCNIYDVRRGCTAAAVAVAVAAAADVLLRGVDNWTA